MVWMNIVRFWNDDDDGDDDRLFWGLVLRSPLRWTLCWMSDIDE